MTRVTYTHVADLRSIGRWACWEARREGQAAPVGYGDDQREALEALLRAEHKATT